MPASDAQQLNGLIEKIVSNKDAFYIWEKILYRYQNGCLTDVIKKVEASNAIEKQFKNFETQFKDVKKQFKDCVVPQQQLNDAQTQFKDVKKQCEDAIKQLRDAIKPLKESIVANNAQEILFDIVWNQFEANIKNGLNPEDEGFHVPQPWNGDINAPVLFLGSNPGFTPEARSPRYFKDGFRWKGGNSEKICITEVLNFFKNRFQKEPYSIVEAVGEFTVALDGDENKPGGVPYWNKMYEFLKQLYGMELEPPKEDETNEEFKERVEKFTRGVMKNGVCTEVIPFVSQSEEGLITPELKAYCWKEFSSEILKLSKASLFVLVGGVAMETVLKAAFPTRRRRNARQEVEIILEAAFPRCKDPAVSLLDANDRSIGNMTAARKALRKGEILNCRILNCGSYGETKKVIAIKHLSYNRGPNELPDASYFDKLSKELVALKKAGTL